MPHVVTRPTPMFTTASGSLEVHQLPAAEDNLVWLLRCTQTNTAAVVDGPDAEAALQAAEALGCSLSIILNTHTHGDHIGINRDLESRGLLAGMAVIGPAGAAAAVPGITRAVTEGDAVRVGDAVGRVLLTEGHINGHISFVFEDVLFCGDTMFAGGCGYLFDGPPPKMFRSLLRLAELDSATRVCCAHEYTQDNLTFAWHVEPDNEALADRILDVWARRAHGACTVPSTIAEERATNPFLRPGSPTLIERVSKAMPDRPMDRAVDVFAATRALKDRGDHRGPLDPPLPVD
jgi:hydroxyacylglutathione hydrolase